MQKGINGIRTISTIIYKAAFFVLIVSIKRSIFQNLLIVKLLGH